MDADRGHKLSLRSCRFRVVATFQGDFWYYKIDGWARGRANQ